MEKCYVKIVVEGDEETAFFNVVKQLGTNEIFVLEIEDARGHGNIADLFLSALREGELYDCVICVFDVDDKAKQRDSPYNMVRKQLMSIFQDSIVIDAISFCTNPNILQYFLLSADSLPNVALKTTSKSTNSNLVRKYWPKIALEKTDEFWRKIKSGYIASRWQLEEIEYSIINNVYSYDNLLKNAVCLSLDYKNDLPAGNLLPLLIALKNGDVNYFKRIRELIDGAC